MKTQWYIKDLIDLEYFLHIDAEEDTGTHQIENDAHDREFFLKNIQPHLPETKSYPRRFIIKSWLDRRRKTEKGPTGTETILPGEAFDETFQLLKYVLFIIGGLIGIGLAFSLLTYTGTAPLNISVYLGATVFIQVLLLLFLGGLFLIRLIQPRLFYKSIIYSALSRFAVALTGKLRRRTTTALSGARREGLSAVLGLVQGKKQVYGSLFYWPVFNSMQLFGIGFNLGILVTTLLKVLGTDLAFGWQSTLQVGADAVHGIVKWMALPWSWFVSPELAHPTLSQIEGSHLVLKDGIYHLTTPDLVAWWPFLCFAVLFYGLLPRIILYFTGQLAQKYLLNNIELNHADCDQLIDRMTTPDIHFGKPEESLPEKTGVPFSGETAGTSDKQQRDKKFAALIPNEIYDTVSNESLSKITGHTLGGQVVEKIRIDDIKTADSLAQTWLNPSSPKKGWTHILILTEAWQPPLIEDIAFIKALRHQLGDHIPILIVLIGKPWPDTIFTPVKPINWQTWKDKIAAMGDPYLRTERLVHDKL